MSSTIRSDRSHVSARPITSRFTAISPTRFSSRVSNSVSNQWSVEVNAALRSHRFGEPIRRNVGSVESLRVVEVFVARQAAVDRLPQEIRQRKLGVQSAAGVAQVFGDDRPQPEAFVQLADQNQPGVRSDARSLKRHLQEPVERELKGRGFFLTTGCHPFWRGSPCGTHANQGVTTTRMGESTTVKSEIRDTTDSADTDH